MKYLTASVFTLFSISIVQATDFVIPYQSYTASPVVLSSTFSWTGFYFGGKIGVFSGQSTSSFIDSNNVKHNIIFQNQSSPKLSGVVGGLYTGLNININNGFVLGFDTDINWSGAKDTKVIDIIASLKADNNKKSQIDFDIKQSLQQKWLSAIRGRIGFSFDRVMPYIAGGISVTKLQSTYLKFFVPSKNNSLTRSSLEKTPPVLSTSNSKIMNGYTIGGGLDFAITDNFILRAEYNYSDFGKKEFVNNNMNVSYKSNAFYFGVACKF
ncbi:MULTISPECIES: outer membrane protein [Bartonella]|uniref:Hemin binding protein D n=1 Tax=Bartonella rochalimae ATCC BAA-1498 TaxID=685782 RepID=E6YMI2_9HYPH|nr:MULTISPECIES: outer membrane beta-barrel protein [Bartonella]AQX18156.1 outer membrane immunogenic protein [Bartonella sp. A1379B]KEC57053.1 hypothetical protein O99_00475 [Bartonella rochalimae ATCC BAA-1498]CBI78084.1 Hemin binding protein D [Bartonella rochalimae ATCC BAA-1498]